MIARPEQSLSTTPEPRHDPPFAEDTAIETLLASAKVLNERNSPDSAHPAAWRKSQLVESSFKYPLLQVDESWRRTADGREQRISRTVHVADHAMMRFPAGFDREQVAAWCAGHGFSIRRKLKTDDVFLIQIPNAAIDSVAAMVREFQATFGTDKSLALAEADSLVFADAMPSDPSFGSLWGLHNTGQSSGLEDADIDAPEAWSLSTGSRDVIVGVIDSGIDHFHPDLSANMWTNPGEIPGNGIDDDGNGYKDDLRGWDFYGDDDDPMDENGHGTHCAGTIGAVGDNGTGVAGVNWEVSLVGLRFLSAGGSGSTSDAVEAVNYARKLGLSLTSNSWGGGSYNATLEQAIRSAGEAGQLFVAAAGNDATDNDLTPHYPSSYALDNVIAVASTTRADALSSFSCFGRTTVDLAAPGTDILSTIPGAAYGTKSGTSMATPHVAGAAALLYSISPGRGHVDIKEVLLQTADPLPVLNGLCVSGGRLNVSRAAAYVAGPRVTLDTVARVELTGNQDGNASPGETIALDVSFKSAGSEPAENCTATVSLAAPVPGVAVAGGPFTFDYLDPGQVADPTRFIVTLDSSLATPAVIPLAFTVVSTGGQTWTEAYALDIHTVSLIRGQVTRLDGAGTVAGATVSYSGPRTGSVTTDQNGRFEFRAVNGTFTLQAGATGYMPSATVTRSVPPAALDVELRLGTAELHASPGTLAESLPAGDAVTRTIQLHNPGTAALRWTATTAYPGSGTLLPAHAAAKVPDPDHPGALRIQEDIPSIADDGVDLAGISIGTLMGGFPTFAAEMASRGASVRELGLPLDPEALDEVDVVVIDDTSWSLTAADIALLRAWAAAGGSMLLEGDESFSMGNTNQLLADTGIQGQVRAGFGFATVTDILPHEITRDVGSILANSYGAYCSVSGAAEVLARYPSGDIFAAVSTLGSGRIFYAGNEITYSGDWASGDTRRFLHQTVDWLATRKRWLKVEGEKTGTIPPGGTVTLEVSIDSSFMEAGLYEARVVLTSDSPLTPSREIPVQLTVSDAPGIAFQPPQLEFPECPLTRTITQDAVLVNTGTMDLVIDSLLINDSAFSVTMPIPVTIAPHERLVVPVTFHPDRVGLCHGVLTVTSNDATDENVDLPLEGVGKNGPALTYSPGAFPVTLPQGTDQTLPLTIGNPGDQPL
jgi:subtilisin family serine protease